MITPPAMIEVIRHLNYIFCYIVKHIPTMVTTDPEMQMNVDIAPFV